jgi:hypothetical protein
MPPDSMLPDSMPPDSMPLLGLIMWLLDDALLLIRSIRTQCMDETGYYLALAGGVLNTGQSVRDLDLVAVPDLCRKCDYFSLIKFFNTKLTVISLSVGPTYAQFLCEHVLSDESKLIDIFAVHI